MAEVDLGDDFGGVEDFDWNLSSVSGRRCLAEAIAHRWLDLSGSLFYDRGYGKGISLWLSAAVSENEIAGELEQEALKDERVEDCDVVVTRVGEALSIRGLLTDGEGPFAFTLNVGALKVELIMENAT